MKSSEIKVGKTYYNRGAGTTLRRVIGIGDEFRPFTFYSNNPPPNEPGVQYMQISMRGNQTKTHSDTLYLSSFAKWAGKEVET